jgi:3'-phosphoadenosine 5'-phosphosulfate sulfotransferase (PAPS reductase)/FAD synthetase
MIDTLDRHEKIALQVSGGRDSLACLYLMRPYWDRLTVYWLNTGDPFPETVDIMAKIAAMVPHYVEIAGNQPATVRDFGIPTDILPVSATPIGIMGAGGGTLMQDRYSCCWRSLMAPMHQKMIDDGVTLIVRGQRADDKLKTPITSGTVIDGIECLLPIEQWTAEDVNIYLETDVGIELPKFYATMTTTPDCMTCSAWWEENRSQYLKTHYPDKHALYQQRLEVIRIAVTESIQNFNIEVEN